jgi:hypothetical protein
MARHCLSKSYKRKVEHPVRARGTSETLADVAAVEGYSTLDQSIYKCRECERHMRSVFRRLLKLRTEFEPSWVYLWHVSFSSPSELERCCTESIACEA